MTRILHYADLHHWRGTAENTRPAMAAILELAREFQPDLIVNAGDLSMRRGSLEPETSLELRAFHVELAEIAPTIVVAGNHDLATAGSEVGAVLGALGEARADEMGLQLFERPGFGYASDLRVACLPYPSKAWLLAQRPEVGAQELNAVLSALLLETLHGLAAQIPAGERAILVYHGSIAGARTDSEQSMSTEMDLVLPEHEIPACFEAVLCGHIHRPQQIGRAVYSGSPAPLTFAEEKSAHGCTLWSTGEESTDWTALSGSPWRYRHAPLPVAHPLRTYDLTAEGAREQRLEVETGARCRVRLMLKPGEEMEALRASYTAAFTALGAHEVRVQIERPEEVRVAGPEVHADASLDSLLAIYCDRHPEAAELLPELVTLAHELEGRLAPEVRMQAQAGAYSLERLEWSNWKSYAEGQALDFSTLGRLVAIEGENATGKSNVAELEAFALYGRFIRGDQALVEAVRIGASEAKVSATFEAAGERWKIERRIRVNVKGRGAQDLALFRLDDTTSPEAFQTIVPASLGTARETQALIERLVGPFALYCQTRFASQGQIDSLLNLTASETKDVLQQALATGLFDARETVARPVLQAAERAIEKHEAGLAAWREIAAEKAERAAEVDSQSAALGADREGLERSEAARHEAEVVVLGLRRDVEQLAEREQAWQSSAAAVWAVAGRITAHENTVKVSDWALTKAGAAEEARAELPALTDLLRRLRSADETRRQRKAVLDAEQRALSGLQREAERLILHRSETRNAAMAQARTALDDATRRAGMIARAPFGKQCVEAKCPFIADAAQAQQRVPALTLALEQAKGMAVGADPAAEQEIERQREAVTFAEYALAEVAADELGLKRAETRVAQLEALAPVVEAGRDARARREVAEKELASLKPEHARLLAEHEALGARPEEGAARASLAEAEARLSAASAEVARAKAAVERALEALATARARLEQAVDAERKIEGAAAETAALARRRRVAETWLAACGRDGLPFLMLERALPALASHANHFLCADLDSGLRLEIDGLRELRSGEQRSEVVIRYSNDFGTHSLAAASGFERVAIGYALRASLAQVQAEAHGFTVSHFVADEGFGVFSEMNVVRVGQPMLRRLAERFGRVLVISHQAPITAICDTRLRVEADHTRGSRLTGGAVQVSPEMEMAL